MGNAPDTQKPQQHGKDSRVYTSKSHPIYVDWLVSKYTIDHEKDNHNKNSKPKEIAIDFRIGMTLCAGKTQANSAYGVNWKRNINLDLKEFEKLKVDIVVTLLSKQDLIDLKVDTLIDDIKKHSMESVWFDIEDGSTPQDVESWKKQVIYVAEQLTQENKTVVVHCMGGLNRTGMFVLSVLKYLKLIGTGEKGSATIDDGVHWIAQSRKNAGGNYSQIQFVKKLTF